MFPIACEPADVQADEVEESDVIVDQAHRTYRLKSYPAVASVLVGAYNNNHKLGFLRGSWWYVVFGAFLFAALAQIKFLFPCFNGYTAVTWGAAGDSYCVPVDRVVDVTPSSCPADICSKRIPVTLSTYAAMLNGALAGRTGALATLLYVIMVCVGAPFGSNGVTDPVWNKGAIVGSSGGYFYGEFCLTTKHNELRAYARKNCLLTCFIRVSICCSCLSLCSLSVLPIYTTSLSFSVYPPTSPALHPCRLRVRLPHHGPRQQPRPRPSALCLHAHPLAAGQRGDHLRVRPVLDAVWHGHPAGRQPLRHLPRGQGRGHVSEQHRQLGSGSLHPR